MFKVEPEHKLLITGASGFLGGALFSFFEKNLTPRSPIRVLVRNTSALARFKHIGEERYEPVFGDLNNISSLYQALKGIDIVIHSGALVSFAQRDYRALYQTNVVGTRNLVDASLIGGVKRFLHISSTAAIGSFGDGSLSDERTPFQDWQRRIGYMISKYFAEFEILRGVSEGLNAVMINPGVIFGDEVRHQNSATQLIRQIGRGKIPYFPTGGVGVVGLQEVCKAALAALQVSHTGTKHVIIAENLSYQNLFDLVYATAGRRAVSLPIPEITGRFAGLLMDAVALLGVKKPFITFDTMSLSEKSLFYDHSKSKTDLALSYPPFQETISKILSLRSPQKNLL
ncbi:MAG: NAD-dependent epimerase/dehydratase family protein [Chloroherpetonaceae bacterium]|nr:NAD-dependent epimerase/dehydratase family protein [Chloroherpetonaceae bacterium]